jgi:ribulose-phosphate 3-epimerase
MLEIIPTVVPQSLEDVLEARKRYSLFAPSLHIDIADGVFAPNTTWSLRPGEKLPDAPAAKYEVHLMVASPLQAGMAFARAGAERVIAHVESFDNVDRARDAFDMWQKAGAKEVGIAVLLTTPLEDLMLYAQLSDFVHVMTIESIGKQGAPFDERSLKRIVDLHTRYPRLTISVDGGGGEKTIVPMKEAGATRFCVGSALAKAKDPAKEYSRLLNVVEAV